MAGTSATAAAVSQAQAAMAQYDLAFQVSPIILVGGIASSTQGGMLPIIALYNQTALFNSGVTDPNAFFARYLPMPGSTLISFAVGEYSFANQQVAANAVIQEPLTLSMLMIAPVNQPGGYLQKLSLFTALQNSLTQHIVAGGTFCVATPAYVYNNLLLIGMTDVTHDESNQVQIQWQLDFRQPLLTLEAAAAAQGNLLSKVTNGQQFNGTPAWSGNSQAQLPQATTGLTAALGQFGGSFAPSNPAVPGATSATVGAEGI
jgi:hypothetical protein